MAGLPWFRMYADFLEDPKMISLAFEDQRHFISILALKAKGVLDQECDERILDRIVARSIWVENGVITEVKARLLGANLIDDRWQPLAWEKRQYKSDSSTERVHKWRMRKGKSE